MSRSCCSIILLLLFGYITGGLTRAEAVHNEVDEIIAMARAAARADENMRSADLFRKAISLAPSRRMEWLRELADQMTYSGEAGEAAALYREVLAAQPDPEEELRARAGLALALSWSDRNAEALKEYDYIVSRNPNDLEARLNRARVLSWLGKNDMSKRAYDEILKDYPENAEARRNLARVQSWRGKHRDAERLLEEHLSEHPDDMEAILILAQAQYWMGRPDRAESTLTGRLSSPIQYEPAQRLLDEIRFHERPDSRACYQYSDQSDRLEINTISLEQNFDLNGGRTTLGPLFQFINYEPGEGLTENIPVYRPGLHASHRFDDAWETTGFFFVDLIDHQGDGGHVTPTYDIFLTYRPNDDLRFDLGTDRVTFDNIKSLNRNITAHHISFSADYIPYELTRYTLRLKQGFYSDDNRQSWGQLELEHRILNNPRIFLGWRFTLFDFSRQLDNGYFNPDSYLSNSITFKSYGPVKKGLHYNLSGSVGFEQADPDDGRFIWDAWFRLNYWVTEAMEIEGSLGYFSSATASSGGFERGIAGLALRAVW